MVALLPFLAFLLSCNAASAFTENLPDHHNRNSTCVNGPNTRNCWIDGFDINTNYYKKWPDTGVVRKYHFVVQNTTIAPDGVEVHGLTVNGQIPGPTIEGNWGDRFEIYVENQLDVNGTVLHWHGLRQLHSNQYDGVAGVVQCPIAPGKSMLYKFQATEYGSSWYHSHFTVQYTAGIQGGILIHGPATANYDVDLGTMTIADWTHSSVFGELIGEADADLFPQLNDGLLNGTNVYKQGKTITGKYHENEVTKGKKYRFRLINSSASIAWRFTIDNHNFTIISNDFVPVQPQETDNVILTQGQRYDIIVDANQPVDNYWMRAIKVNNGFPAPDQRNIRGILRYVGANQKAKPTTTNRFLNHTVNNHERNFTESLTPYLELNVGEEHLDRAVLVTEKFEVALWTMNGSSFLLDWNKPTISELFDGANLTTFFHKHRTDYNSSSLPEGYNLPDTYNGTVFTSENIWHVKQPNKWVYFVMNNIANQTDVHPIHLHGHDFWVLAQGKGRFNPAKDSLNLNNPPRRDVANLLPFGYMVIAFFSDNPGLWLMHCHIAWHVSEGLSLQWLEREDEVLQYYDPHILNETCRDWKAYVKDEVWGQDDSGVKKLL